MKKKILVYGLVAALSLSMLSGCGSRRSSEKGGHKVDKSIKEVAENVARNISDVDSMKMGLKGNIDIAIESSGIKYSIKGNGEMNGVFVVDNPAFNLDGKVSYELNQGASKLSGEYSAEAYGETDGEIMNVYGKTNISDWECESFDVSEYVGEISEFKDEIGEFAEYIKGLSDEEIAAEIGEYVNLEGETKSVNGKECYVISADLDINDIKKMDEDFVEDEDEMEFDKLDCSYGICIDVDTYMPVKMYINISAHVIEENAEYTINSMGFEFNFISNSGKVKSAPKDAKESANDSDGPSDIFGSITSKAKDAKEEDEKEENANDYGTVDTKYIPKTFKLDGKEYKFGDKVSTMLDAGYEIELNEEHDGKIGAYGISAYYLKKPGSNSSFLVYMDNDTDSDIDMKDATIKGISVMETDGVTLELDNGITLESSISDVKKVYENQKASYEFEGQYSSVITYEDEDYNEVEYSYDVESGKLNQIEVMV